MYGKSAILFCYIAIILLALVNTSNAQIPVYKYSFKTDFSIPVVTGSRAYRNTFSGVMSVNPAFNAHTPFGVYATAGFNYLQNKTANSKNFNLGVLEVKHHILSPYAAVGYEYFNGGNFFWRADFSYRRSFGRFSRSLVPDSVAQEPQLTQQFNEFAISSSISFYSDEHLSFGFNVGYHIQQYSFDPFPYYFDTVNNNTGKEDISNRNSFITFGLGFTYHFAPFKKQPIRESK